MRRGFTLIELLLVLAMIVLLMWLGVTAYSVAFSTSTTQKARVLLSNLTLAMTEYTASTRQRVQYTPDLTRPADHSMRVWTAKLMEAPSSREVLLKLPLSAGIDDTGDGEPDYFADPWGTPIQYRMWHDGGPFTAADPPVSDTVQFIMRGSPEHPQPFLVSAGPDRTFGTEDDIYGYDCFGK